MRRLQKIAIGALILGFSIILMTGCAKSALEGLDESNSEDVMYAFMESFKNDRFEDMAELIWPEYFNIVNTSKEEYIENANIAKEEYEVKLESYQLFPITKYGDGIMETGALLNVKIGKGSDAEYMNDSMLYALIEEDGKWMVSPMGVLGEVQYENEGGISEDEFSMYLNKSIEYTVGTEFEIRVVNNSDIHLGFGDDEGATMVVETTENTYEVDMVAGNFVPKGIDDYLYLGVDDMKGDIEKITITPIVEVTDDGEIVENSNMDYVVYENE